MGEIVKHIQRDRVSVSYGRTINIGNFESIKVDVGYSTDLRKEESVEDALTRADEVATKKLEELTQPLESKPKQKKKGK